jgi:hypothetical protein
MVGTAVAWGSHQQWLQRLQQGQRQQQVVRHLRHPCCRAWATQVCLQWTLPGPWSLQLQPAAAWPHRSKMAPPVTLVWAARGGRGAAAAVGCLLPQLLPQLLPRLLVQRHLLWAPQLAAPPCQAAGPLGLPRVEAPRAAVAAAARVSLCAAAAATVPPGRAASSSSSTKKGAQEQQQGLTHLLGRVLRQQQVVRRLCYRASAAQGLFQWSQRARAAPQLQQAAARLHLLRLPVLLVPAARAGPRVAAAAGLLLQLPLQQLLTTALRRGSQVARMRPATAAAVVQQAQGARRQLHLVLVLLPPLPGRLAACWAQASLLLLLSVEALVAARAAAVSLLPHQAVAVIASPVRRPSSKRVTWGQQLGLTHLLLVAVLQHQVEGTRVTLGRGQGALAAKQAAAGGVLQVQLPRQLRDRRQAQQQQQRPTAARAGAGARCQPSRSFAPLP